MTAVQKKKSDGGRASSRASSKRRATAVQKNTTRRKTADGSTSLIQSPAAEEQEEVIAIHEPSAAGNKIGCSFDLLVKILIRLPAKTLIRFKCVSKKWLSVISNSEFAGRHSRLNPRPWISGFFFYNRNILRSVSLYGKRNPPSLAFAKVPGRDYPIRVLDCCSGLLLLGEDIDYRGTDFVAPQYLVCNVSARKYSVVPQLRCSGLIYHCAYLAFDPSKSPDYKVVVVYRFSSSPDQIHVFSSQSSSWKQFFVQHKCLGRGPGAYWNGAIHWAGDKDFCLTFNVESGEMIAIPNPPHPAPKLLPPDNIRFLGKCGGRFFLVQCSRKVLGFNILELCEGVWSRFYQVNLRPIIAAFPDLRTTFEFDVLSLLCDGSVEKKEDFTLVLAIPGRIISYNPHLKRFDELCDLPRGELIDRGRNAYAYPFVETLSPV